MKARKYSVLIGAAALAATAAIANAGITLSATDSGEVDGYDEITIAVTALTAPASTSHSGNNGGISSLNFTYTATNGGVIAFGTDTTADANSGSGFTPPRSFEAFTSQAAFTATGGNGSGNSQTGTAINVQNYTTIATQPHTQLNLTGVDGGTTVAEIFVTHGDGLTFGGTYGVVSTSATQTEATQTYTYAGSSLVPLISLVPKSSSVTTGGTELTTANTSFTPSGQGYIQVLGGTGAYAPANATVTTSPSTNGVNASVETQFGTAETFTSGDTEYYALDVNLTGGTLANLVTDLNGTNGFGTAGNKTGASSVSASTTNPEPSVFGSQYNVFITASGASTTQDTLLGWNFSSANLAADDPSNFSSAAAYVSAVAAVPEPATAAAVIISAAGLLIGRRRRTVA